MQSTAHKIKQKMLELTRLFCIERNIFQRFVIVYRYIRLLNKDPLTKEVLQKMFDESTKVMGRYSKDYVDEGEFLDVKGEAIYSNNFWMYYSNLEVIHAKMKNIKKCKLCDKNKFDNLCRLYSKPYSDEMLALSFKVINSNVFDELDKKCFFDEDRNEGKTYFDEKKSVLYVKGKGVYINRQDKTTNAHKILKYIFIDNKKNLEDEFFYSEIAKDEFGDIEYKQTNRGWEKYRIACRDIQAKIKDQTNNQIKDFLIFNTGSKGRVKINPKYL